LQPLLVELRIEPVVAQNVSTRHPASSEANRREPPVQRHEYAREGVQTFESNVPGHDRVRAEIAANSGAESFAPPSRK